MCGIAGKVTTGESVSQALLDVMCEGLRHRGPDSQGTHVEGQAGLGIRRLAIIDLVTGDQPFSTEDGSATLVLNGEIYNYVELREELMARGHRFASGSDAEVVIHLYEEMGPRCVERLRGMFAFAIWDEARRRLLLARDRIGKKPLFYAPRPDALTFASEPRSILQDEGVSREPDMEALDAYLVNQYVPHDRCAFRALRKLPPASTLVWSPGSEPVVERYWRLEYAPKQVMDDADAAERLRQEILEATRIRLRSDVPLGAFLSGGVDSSIVVAAMAQAGEGTVRTFSVGFPGTDVDESEHARRVAQLYGTEHHELEVGPPEPDLLPRLAWHFGEPFADPAALPTLQLSEVIRREVTVALNGDGGDESFAGYDRYRALVRTLPVDRAPLAARRALAAAAVRAAGGVDGMRPARRIARQAARAAMAPAYRYADFFRYFTDIDRRRLYGPALREAAAASDPLAHVARAWDGRAGLDPFDRLMATDLDTYLADDLVAKVDVTSMAASIEVRSPLLDAQLMEFCARLPVRQKSDGRSGKLLLRDAVRPWLPDAILDRPKQGFAVPLAGWLRRELREVPEEVLLDPAATARGLFEPAAVRTMIAEHRAGEDRSQRLWAMINLELWFRTCVDRAPVTEEGLPAL